jgi:DNA-binding GntR family transcriptional regulator
MSKYRWLTETSPIPLCRQLEQIIKTTIERGELKQGDTFWTEQELAQMYGVSRITVHEALRGLLQEGYLVTQQGNDHMFQDQRELLKGLRVIKIPFQQISTSD